MEFVPKDRYDIQDLVEIVRLLREPDGCPWDREQTHQSIRTNLIEETYEVAEAIDLADSQLLCEELGDLLLQIMLHSRMEQEQDNFDFDTVCDGICKKLVHRHPHVFGQAKGLDTQEVLDKWEQLKNNEKGRHTAADRLDSVPLSLPALMRSTKVQKRADDFGFRYQNVLGALDDLSSELDELRQALLRQAESKADGSGIEHEVGDVLFSTVNVARMAGIDAEEALTKSCNRFVYRVKRVEQLAGTQPLEQVEPQQLDHLWNQAKQDCAISLPDEECPNR